MCIASFIYIEVNILNTYAWISATAISNIVINTTTNIGNILNTESIPPAVNIVHVNPDNIANNKCPAVIFAANRTPNDTPLASCDINSITTKNPANTNGLPPGIIIAK